MAEGGNSSGAVEVSKMEGASNGEGGGSGNPHDWEYLTMTKSVADLKPEALGIVEETAPLSEQSGVAEAAMHSQYFGHDPPSAFVFPSSDASAEEVEKQQQQAGDEEDKMNEVEDVAAKLHFESGSAFATADPAVESALKEQPVESALKEELVESALKESAVEEQLEVHGSQAKFTGPEFGEASEPKPDEKPAAATLISKGPPAVAAALRSSSCESGRKGWMSKHLDSLKKRLTMRSALSVALVAVVATGLLIITRRWNLRALQPVEELPLQEERIEELAKKVAEAVEMPPPSPPPKAPVVKPPVHPSRVDSPMWL